MTRRLIQTLIALAILSVSTVTWAQDGELRIAIITSDNLTSTTRSLNGARKTISQEHPEAQYFEVMISGLAESDKELVDSVRNLSPTLILSVGSAATGFAKDNFTDLPIAFCAVTYPVLSGFVSSFSAPGQNITGASLNIPVDVQFKYFARIVPNLKRIGVLYSQNTAPLIPQAEVVAQSMGMELVALKIDESKELPAALETLANQCDGLWSLADPNLFDSKTTKYIILNTLRRRIPFMGFSRNVVESGALFSIDFDYKAIGFQVGRIVNRIVAGEAPGSISVTTSDANWFHYNEKTADHIGIKIPEELVAVAREVYK
jgi:putative ABC transport system substrate-binding protein